MDFQSHLILGRRSDLIVGGKVWIVNLYTMYSLLRHQSHGNPQSVEFDGHLLRQNETANTFAYFTLWESCKKLHIAALDYRNTQHSDLIPSNLVFWHPWYILSIHIGTYIPTLLTIIKARHLTPLSTQCSRWPQNCQCAHVPLHLYERGVCQKNQNQNSKQYMFTMMWIINTYIYIWGLF